MKKNFQDQFFNFPTEISCSLYMSSFVWQVLLYLNKQYCSLDVLLASYTQNSLNNGFFGNHCRMLSSILENSTPSIILTLSGTIKIYEVLIKTFIIRASLLWLHRQIRPPTLCTFDIYIQNITVWYVLKINNLCGIAYVPFR